MDTISERLVQAVVLLQRQYLLTEHLIQTRGPVLQDFETAVAEQRQGLDNVLDAYNYVFALVDHLVRYEKIAFGLPRLNQKSAHHRALRAGMGTLKQIRNQLQHLNNGIENANSGPLLGAICWVSGIRQFMAFFHDIGRARSSPGIIFDTRDRRHLQQFCYVCNDTYHDLGAAIDAMRAFDAFISEVVHVTIDGKPYDPKDHYGALCVEVRLPETI